MKEALLWLMLVNLQVQAARMLTESGAPVNAEVIRFAYVNRVGDWSSAAGIARSIGVPGYATDSEYNYICLTFWLTSGPADTALVWDNPMAYMGASELGSTNEDIRTNILTRFHNAGIKLLVSAFGATEKPTTEGKDPVATANSLASYVSTNKLDGVDVDWEDTPAFQSGVGEQWLIAFTTTLRTLLPNAIITHAPQGPYFVGDPQFYPNGGYIKVEQEVGSMIQFYNVQFYNQQSTPYNTSQGLFNVSGGWAPGTSVNQIIAKGIPATKIVVGKPANAAQAYNSGYMTPSALSAAFVDAYNHNGWKTGLMIWQYAADTDGSIVSQMITPLLNAVQNGNGGTDPVTDPSTDAPTDPPTSAPTDPATDPPANSPSDPSIQPPTDAPTSPSTDDSSDQPFLTNSSFVRFGYVNRIADWSSANTIAASMGVPGYTSSENFYSHICLDTWIDSGTINVADIWSNPLDFFGHGSVFGSTDESIRADIISKYHDKGIKLLIKAFGPDQFPCTIGLDPVLTAHKLATYVADYALDGVDVSWDDTLSLKRGTGETWLIAFTSALNHFLPSNSVISHSPLASYFSTDVSHYPHLAYVTVHQHVGAFIDFYNVRFFDQGDSTYDTAQSLFNVSCGWAAGTAVNQIVAKGVPANKLVVGKPVTVRDSYGTGYIPASDLSQAFETEYAHSQWSTGIAFWHFSSDEGSSILESAAKKIVRLSSTTS